MRESADATRYVVVKRVVDPDGVGWSVRRRWDPWRRALSLHDLLASTPSGTKSDTEADEREDTELPRNVLLKVGFVVLAALVGIVYFVGKVLVDTVVVVLLLVGSLIKLVVALAVMPITLLLRMLGQTRWPIEIVRAGEHFGTRHAADFAAAGEMRDGLIGRGLLPADQQASVG